MKTNFSRAAAAAIIALVFAAAFLLTARPVEAQTVFGQNQILPSSYLGDGYVISTSTSGSHKLTAGLIDLAGSWLTGILPLSKGGTGANLTDPNADRILFWDDSAGQNTWLTVGSGLSITGTTISTTGSGITSIGPAGQLQTGGTQTLATSTDTNLLLTITGSGDTITFTPSWTGTLADARVSDTLTIGSGSTIADGALSANVSLLGQTIGAAELASADFGSFTCNGTSCTVDASAISNAMLANSTISGVSLGGTLAALTATDSTLTFSGSYTGAAARTVGINLGNANTWSATQTFGTLIASVGDFASGVLRATYNAALSLATNGDIGIDSTSNQFRYRSGGADRVLGNGNFYPAFTYATTTAWTGTTTIPLGPAYVAETWNGVQCFTDAGTVQVSFTDGTNRMNWMNASTTVGSVALSSNNTFVAAEKRYVELGTPASSPTKISCTVSKSLTSD